MRKLMRRLTVAAVLGVVAGVGVPANTTLAEPPAGAQNVQEYFYTVIGVAHPVFRGGLFES